MSDYWQNAAIPAYNRMGIQPDWRLYGLAGLATSKIYVLIPCDSLDIFASIPAKLAADTTYQTRCRRVLWGAEADPPYERFESSLNIAFDAMKKLLCAAFHC